MGNTVYELRILFDRKGDCRSQFIYETDQLMSYPFNMDDPSNMIDNLGNKCQLFIVSNEKLELDDLYLLTNMNSIEYGICVASSERIVSIANFSPLSQRKVLMTTDIRISSHPKIMHISDDILKLVMDIYNKQSDKNLQEVVENYIALEDYYKNERFEKLRELDENHKPGL